MRRKLLLGLVVLMVVAAGWVITGPLRAWRSIERVPFNPTAARAQLNRQGNPLVADPSTRSPPADGSETAVESATPESAKAPSATPDPPPATVPEVQAASAEAPVYDPGPDRRDLDVFLILGSDARLRKESIRADAIMLLITNRTSTLLVSIPRLLYVTNPCTGERAPINTNLEGCGEVTGLDLTAIAVEDYTGLSIDHLVMFGFEGFESIIDRIGGLEVCVENPAKLQAAQSVFLDAGCSVLDGARALQWVRSRMTLELVNDKWKLMEDAGDGARTERQRQVVLQVLQQLDQFNSPGALNSVVRELADSFVLDSGWGLPEAVSLAWDLRSISRGQFRATAIAATGAVTTDGEFVLEPTGSFADVFEDMFG